LRTILNIQEIENAETDVFLDDEMLSDE